jgi:hypothetical protein
MTMERDLPPPVPEATQSITHIPGEGHPHPQVESSWERYERRRRPHTNYYSEDQIHEMHHRRYHPRVPRPPFMEPTYGYCERCAQRDYDRYYDLLHRDRGGTNSPRDKRVSASNTVNSSGNEKKGNNGAGNELISSPREDKPDAETIWDGTTWDACPTLLMPCAPVRVPLTVIDAICDSSTRLYV